jgi:DnaJ-class molecular chaperone
LDLWSLTLFIAKKFHPLNSKIDMATNAQQFASVCEAYEVLSNAEYKAIYDAYGEKVLKHGFEPDKHMDFEGVYQYKGNAHDIFNAYFDTGTEFREKPSEFETDFHHHIGKKVQAEQEAKVSALKCNSNRLLEIML